MGILIAILIAFALIFVFDLALGKITYKEAPRQLGMMRAEAAGLDPYDVPADSFIPGMMLPFIVYREFKKDEGARRVLTDSGDGFEKTGWKITYGPVEVQ